MAYNRQNKVFRILKVMITCLILLASLASPSMALKAAGDSQVKIQMYNVSRNDLTQQISPQIKLINSGATEVDLSNVVMRYYLTTDGDKPMNFDCWTSVGKANLTTKFIKMAESTNQTDTYLEIGFTSGAGMLKPGQTVDIVSWFNKSDWSSFKQNNDYSFNSQDTTYEDWDKMTAYVNGELNWGIEPVSSSSLSYPLNLQGVAKENSIDLTWNPVDRATSYDLEVDGKIEANLTYASYKHENLAQGSTHTYRVKAKAGATESDWSPAITLNLAVSETLFIPMNIMATPSETSIALTWDPVPKATGYEVEANGKMFETAIASFTHKELTPDTTYSYRVRAKNAVTVSGWSPVKQMVTLPKPISTTKLKVNVKTGTSASTQMPSPGFEVYNESKSPIPLKDVKLRYYFTVDSEKPLSIGFWSTTTKEHVTTRFVKMPIPSEQSDYYLEIGFTDMAANLQPGSKVGIYTWINKGDWSSFNQVNDYSFKNSSSYEQNEQVTAYIGNKLDWGIEPILKDMPAFPENINTILEDTQITLMWDPVPGATSYDVEADGTLIENIEGTSFIDKWLNPGTRHNYKVRAKNGNKLSVWCSLLTVKTSGEQNLPAPLVTAKKASNAITINWEALKEEITGYEIEVDGILYDLGKNTSYTHANLDSPSTHTYRVRAKDGTTMGKWSQLLTLNTIFEPTGDFNVRFTVDTSKDRAPISPYIYGTNDDLTGEENFTARRIGGNRMTTYNWENNASNAGDDWHHSSDNFIPWYYGGIPWGGNMDEPAIGISGFHNKSLQQGAYTLATLQTSGYVAADKNGNVLEGEMAPSSRWVPVMPSKNAPFSLAPDLSDNAVYMDEFVNYLVHKHGDASTPTGIKGYSIDNEPALWSKTHPYMHPDKAAPQEVLEKSIELSRAVKKVDPFAEMFGPVLYGFSSYLFLDSNDWDSVKGSYDWYIDYYLDKMRVASLQEGKRLLDVLDLHWYPEVASNTGVRITSSNTNENDEVNKLRMQAPRSLWDPSYQENSWIGQHYRSYLPLIPRLQKSIDMYYSGTKLAFTEYNYGGESHVSGGIATTDVLGIFGKYNVYMANYWKMVNKTEEAPYTSAAFKIFNNYDGRGGKFGDTKVSAETSDIENSSIYGSVIKEDDGKLHLIIMNKNYNYDMNAIIDLTGESYTSARIFAFDSQSSTITEREPITSLIDGSFTYKIPELTVCHIVLEK
jgi:chitodextrinase